MATYTENYSLVKPGYGDSADIDVLNRLMTDKVDALLFENRRISADEYDQEETYAVGDYAIYENVLYKCLEDTTGNFDPSKWEMTNLAKELSTKGGADVTKTASGNPITFDDGADAPLVKCVTEIQGSQDLHGYDKPWVGGSGKNLLSSNRTWLIAENVSGTWTGDTYVRNGVTFEVEYNNTGYPIKITANGTNTSTGSFVFVTARYPFTLDTNYSINGLNNGSMSTGRINVQGVDNYIDGDNLITGDGETHRIGLQISGSATVNNVVWYPMLRYATVTDPTFAPYSNICPITAYTQGEIEVGSRNLVEDKISGMNISSGGVIGSQSSYDVQIAKVVQGVTYTFTTNDSAKVCAFYSSMPVNGSTSYNSSRQTGNSTVTAPITGYIAFRTNANYAYAQCEKGNEATPYVPYITPTTYTTTYPSAIYRGSEDVVNGTVGANSDGEMWVKEVFDGSSDEQWSFSVKAGFRNQNVAYMLFPAIATSQTPIANLFEGLSNRAYSDLNNWQCSSPISSGGEKYINFVVDKTLITSLSDWKTWLSNNNLEVAYKVQTPTTEDVTPTNLPIRTLSGYNHIESSTGDMEVEYITQEFQPLVDLIESNSGKHVYSTNEQVVGTWTDGRNVYERVLTGTMGNNSQISIDLATELGCDMVVDIKGWIVATDSTNQIWMHDSYVRFFVQGVSNLILNKNDAGNYGYDNPYTFIIRYTKPTTPTRSLNLTKSAVEEIPDEIKNAPFEEKPDVNEADDDAPTEVDER